MVTLEQIKELEQRVARAVEVIRLLRDENRTLRGTLDKAQERMGELEELVKTFKNDQAAIEEGIRSAIEKLDALEDEVTESAAPEAKASTEAPVVERTSPAPQDDAGPTPDAEAEDAGAGSEVGDEAASDDEESDGQESEQDRELDIF